LNTEEIVANKRMSANLDPMKPLSGYGYPCQKQNQDSKIVAKQKFSVEDFSKGQSKIL